MFAVQVAAATTTEVVDYLGETGLSIVIATPDASCPIYDVDLTAGTAVVVGAEHAGVSDAWLAAIDSQTATIPMYGRVNSLNVSVSAAMGGAPRAPPPTTPDGSALQNCHAAIGSGGPAGAVAGAFDTVVPVVVEVRPADATAAAHIAAGGSHRDDDASGHVRHS